MTIWSLESEMLKTTYLGTSVFFLSGTHSTAERTLHHIDINLSR